MEQNVMLNDLAQLVRDYLDGHKNRSLKTRVPHFSP
jgi:hypothetical protein